MGFPKPAGWGEPISQKCPLNTREEIAVGAWMTQWTSCWVLQGLTVKPGFICYKIQRPGQPRSLIIFSTSHDMLSLRYRQHLVPKKVCQAFSYPPPYIHSSKQFCTGEVADSRWWKDPCTEVKRLRWSPSCVELGESFPCAGLRFHLKN